LDRVIQALGNQYVPACYKAGSLIDLPGIGKEECVRNNLGMPQA